MSNYSLYQKKEKKPKKTIHPIWRGIGCVLLVVIPIISYIAADFFVTNHEDYSWVIMTRELIVNYPKDPYILEKIFYTAIFVFVLYLILTVITFFIDRFFGPSHYGPYDVPPNEVEINRSKRGH